MVSVRMWVTDAVIVTVRVRRVFALQDIRQQRRGAYGPALARRFCHDLVSRLTTRVQEEVMAISKLTEFFEADLEDESTPHTNRADADPPPRDPPAPLPRAAAGAPLHFYDSTVMPKSDHPAMRELANRTTMAVEELDALRDRLSAVQDDHDLDVARKQARNSFILSVGAAYFPAHQLYHRAIRRERRRHAGLDRQRRAFVILCLVMFASLRRPTCAVASIKWL